MDQNEKLLAKQAQKAAASILAFQRKFGFFYPSDAFKLFYPTVKPVACYDAEIWDVKYSEEIEKVQSKFCKQYIGLKQNTNDAFAVGECDVFLLQSHIRRKL